MRRMLRVLLVTSIALGVGACGDDDDDGGGGSAVAAEGDVTVTIDDFAFEPAAIETGAGETTFAVTNDDTTAHTFTVEDLDIDVAVGAGESGEATATLEAGDYDVVCRIHPSMTGTLTVS